MTKTTKKSPKFLYYQNHVYKNVGPCACPIKGGEDGICKTTSSGKPAWWVGGHLFVLISDSVPLPQFQGGLLDSVKSSKNELKKISSPKT